MQKKALDDLELMRVHFRNEYVINSLGRIGKANHWSSVPAAALLFGRTATANLWHFGNFLSSNTRSLLNEDCRQEPLELSSTLKFKDSYTELLDNEFGDCEVFDSWVFCQKTRPGKPENKASIVQITMENSHLLDKHFSAMNRYESAVIMQDTPIFAEIVDHHAVSVCNSARQSVLGAECYIATTETHRNLGHAKNVTKHWAEEVYNSGKLPFLNTTVNNYATIKIANNLGFSLVGRVLRVSPRNCGEFITTFT
jgi:hypothetical protein